MPTPREERAAARDDRQQHLQLPLGRANLIEIRSRSPSPIGLGAFNFPPPQLQVAPEQFDNAEPAAASNNPPVAMAAADATVQALTDALQGVRVSSRKPELPAFDPKNVDVWLKRVDNAYRRAGVTDAKDKFAFIEPKFSVDADPRINELLYGNGTADEWTEFESYLRGRYGRTKSQQAAIILDGVQRDGKLPSEMFALVKERIGSITVDEIVKEMVLRELPTEIRRTIHDKVKNLSGAETVKVADEYFDRNGKPLHKPTATPINVVNDVPYLIDTDDEENVNAVNRRFPRGRKPRHLQGQKPPSTKQSQQNSRPPNATFTPAFSEKRTHSGKPTVKPANLCRWHLQFGKEAYTCEAGCDKFGSQKTGKAQAGRHT